MNVPPRLHLQMNLLYLTRSAYYCIQRNSDRSFVVKPNEVNPQLIDVKSQSRRQCPFARWPRLAGLGGQELDDLHLDIIEGTCPQGLDRTAAESHFTLLGAWLGCPGPVLSCSVPLHGKCPPASGDPPAGDHH